MRYLQGQMRSISTASDRHPLHRWQPQLACTAGQSAPPATRGHNIQRSGWRFGLLGLLTLLTLTCLAPAAHSQAVPAPAAAPAEPMMAPTQPPPGLTRPNLRLGSSGAFVSELQAVLRLLGYYSGPVNGAYDDSMAIAVAAFQQAAQLAPDGIVGPATWIRLLPPAPTSEQAATPANPSPAFPRPTAAPTNPAANPAVATPAASPTSTSTAAPSPPPSGSTASPTSPNAEPATTPPPTAETSDPVDLPILRIGMRGPAVARLQERLRATDFYDGPIDGAFGIATQAAVRTAQRRYRLNPDGIVGPATWTALLR